MLVLAVVNLKGGAGKTTAAAFAASALHEAGWRVLLVDADPQRSALTWHEAAPFPFEVVAPARPARLDRDLPGIVGGRWDAVVIDTPPEHGRPAVLAAVRAATHVLVPCAPTPAEYERLRAVRALLDEAAPAAPTVAVLLVRTVAGASSTATYREAMVGDGWRVLRAAVPRRERFAQAFGAPVRAASETGYGWAVAGLIEGSGS